MGGILTKFKMTYLMILLSGTSVAQSPTRDSLLLSTRSKEISVVFSGEIFSSKSKSHSILPFCDAFLQK